MQIKTGDMWSAYTVSDLFLITTNSVVHHGNLVMGAGVAKQALMRFPGINKAMGSAITAQNKASGFYGLLVSARWPVAKLGAFQTKVDWRKDTMPWMIEQSTQALVEWCLRNPGKRVDLNYPGIGNGNLGIEIVRTVINQLPDQVNVWTFN